MVPRACVIDRSIRYATPKLVLRFADMVKKLGPQERLVNFFEAICTVQGRAVKANQEMVSSMLNQVQRNVLEKPTVLSRLQIQTENEFRGLRALYSFVFAFSPFLIFDFVHTAHSPTHTQVLRLTWMREEMRNTVYLTLLTVPRPTKTKARRGSYQEHPEDGPPRNLGAVVGGERIDSNLVSLYVLMFLPEMTPRALH